jgi:hypothetical protein
MGVSGFVHTGVVVEVVELAERRRPERPPRA